MDPIQHLQESVIDGRTENVRYRQNQLQSLHAALCSSADLICKSIAEDTQVESSNTEVETEYYLSTNAVKHFYEGLGFEKSINEEYLIATGVDNPQRKVGYGLVIIRPTTHTRLYSIVCPLAAALAAGNIVIIEVRHSRYLKTCS
jgi:acyl-CoA reductase-like NAD-dependent aldehyde dehydrogenase